MPLTPEEQEQILASSTQFNTIDQLLEEEERIDLIADPMAQGLARAALQTEKANRFGVLPEEQDTVSPTDNGNSGSPIGADNN